MRTNGTMFTTEERRAVPSLLQAARLNCNAEYASRAAGFWLQHQAPAGMRAFEKS